MSEPDVIFEIHEADTSYRISPNPDAEPGTGYQHGAVIQWRDPGDVKWHNQFFIASEAIEAIAIAFSRISDSASEPTKEGAKA